MSSPEPTHPPTKFSRRYIRWIVGFSVGSMLGLAPYLGTFHVPGFVSLLSMYPESLRYSVLPISGFLMGSIVVIMQWLSQGTMTTKKRNRIFTGTIVCLLLFLSAFVVAYTFRVVLIPVASGESFASFVIGSNRVPTCACDASLTDIRCIQEIGFDESLWGACWGDTAIRSSKLILTFLYLLVTSSFSVLVGLLLISNQDKKMLKQSAGN